ncbi:hypothetical protein Psi01_13750 [Planobispora siamensis]|uniref:Uncharacterized protein n=1 Tax=Planobispora siamensis TaxID=936338 RepID=A0A8J3SDW8_9ACTN|nr:hypothetical protein Psi01_13750 [Planobispora siamensis]
MITRPALRSRALARHPAGGISTVPVELLDGGRMISSLIWKVKTPHVSKDAKSHAKGCFAPKIFFPPRTLT